MPATIHKGAYALAVLVAFAAWGWAVRGELSKGGVYGDEPNWINASFVYADLLLERDFTPEHWDCLDLKAWGNLNPHVGKFILGIPLIVDSRLFNGGARFSGKYNFGESSKWNAEHGNIPPPRILYLARAVSLFVSACTAAAMSVCALWLWGRIASLLTLYLLLLNPLFVKCSAYAFTDPGYLLFNVLTLLCGMGLLAASTARARTVAICGLGITAALAASIKVTAMLLLGAFAVSLLGILYLARRWSLRQALAGGAGFGVVLLSVAYALNPFCWPNLWKLEPTALAHEIRLVAVEHAPVNFRDGTTLWDALTQKDLRRGEIRAAYPQLSNLVLRPMELFLLLPRWNRLFSQVPRTPSLELLKRLAWDYSAFPGETLFVAIGAFATMRKAIQGRRDGAPHLAIAAVAILAIHVALLVYKLPVGFARYYLSAVMFLRLFSAAGMVLTIEWAWRRGHAKREGQP